MGSFPIPERPPELEGLEDPPTIFHHNKPKRVWTLIGNFETEEDLPKLPMVTRHLVNAFLEDYAHDRVWRNGHFKYSSRVSCGEQWLLLEFEEGS